VETRKTTFLGLDFDDRTLAQAAQEILGSLDAPFRYVVTPNAHHLVRLSEEAQQLHPLFKGGWRIYCDSRIVCRLARLRGVKLSLVTGSDLTAALVPMACERGIRVAIVGPTEADCELLKRRYPGLQVALHTPPMGFIGSEREVRRCVDFVRGSNARLIFLAVGMPQQEILASRIARESQVAGVALCIGASIDFLTGKQRRAPRWVQLAGLEWLHRLLGDPRRLARRYLIESPKIFYLALSAEAVARSGQGSGERT
jgi:exopolysaccharide biosynthesis WecB/TagA/CpsF family protein